MSTWSEQKAALPGMPLTHREHQVLLAMARGLVTAAIAEELGIGANSVRTFSMRLFVKLGVRTRAQAVAYGCHGGLIPAPPDLTELPEPEPRRRRKTDVRIPAHLADQLTYVLGHTAADRVTDAVRDEARRALEGLNADARPAIPAQRTRDSRP